VCLLGAAQVPDFGTLSSLAFSIKQDTPGSFQPAANPPTVFLPMHHPVTIPFVTQPSPHLLTSPHHGSPRQASQQRTKRRPVPNNTKQNQHAFGNPSAAYSDPNKSSSVARISTENKSSFLQPLFLSNDTNHVQKPAQEVVNLDFSAVGSDNMAAYDSKLPDDLRSVDENDLLNSFLEVAGMQFAAAVDAQPVTESNHSRSLDMIYEDVKPYLSTDNATIPLTVANESLNGATDLLGSVADQTFVYGNLQSFDIDIHSTEDWSNYLHQKQFE